MSVPEPTHTEVLGTPERRGWLPVARNSLPGARQENWLTRLVYLHQYFNTRSEAGGIRSYEFAKRLVHYGYDVHVVTSDRNAESSGGPWRIQHLDGFTVHWLAEPYSNHMSFGRRVLAFLRFALRSSARARALRGDVVFATSTPLTIAIPAVAAKFGRRIPMIFEVRDLWPDVPIAVGALKGRGVVFLARALEKFAYGHADQIVALSPGMAEGVARRGYPRDLVTVIPNAADLDLFAVEDAELEEWRSLHPQYRNRPLVTYAGTFGLVNNVEYLVDVADCMQNIDPIVAFLLVGSGAQKESVKRRASDAGLLNRNVFIEESVAKRELPLILAASSVATSVVLPIPELEANSANKFFDALAAGRPMAVNYSGWQRDLLESNGAGLYLDPHDPQGAAIALHELIADDGRLAEMGTNGRALAVRKFARDELAQELNAVIERALGNSTRSATSRG